MRLELFPTRSRSNLFADRRRLIALALLATLALAAADDPKQRTKYIREVAKTGPDAIAKIEPYLVDLDIDVRREAVKAIGGIGTQRSLDPLIKATADNDAEVQLRAVEGLLNFYVPGSSQTGVTAPLRKMQTAIKGRFTDTNDAVVDPYIQVRPDVVRAIGRIARGGAGMETRAGAARAAGILRGREAVPDLIEASRSKDDQVIYEALVALGKIQDPSAGEAVASRLRDPVEKVQIAAIETTGVLQNRAALYQVRDAMDRSRNSRVRHAALSAMAMMPEPSIRPVFTSYLTDKDEGMRTAAVEGLARLRDPSDQPAVQQTFSNENKAAPRLAQAFALASYGNHDMSEFAPLRYLVNNLNSKGYRPTAQAYLTELARDPGVRRALYPALQDAAATKDEKTGLALALSVRGDRETIPYLEALTRDPDPEVARVGMKAMQGLRARVP
jgi:HEAT repeat protein